MFHKAQWELVISRYEWLRSSTFEGVDTILVNLNQMCR